MDQPIKKQSPWNSLEIAKIAASLLTPLTIALATLYFNHLKDVDAHRQEQVKDMDVQHQEQLRRTVAKRMEIWDYVAPLMNEEYSYFLFVGKWKEITPKQAIAVKRDLDAKMYSNQILFTKEFFSAYQEFMNESFKTGRGWKQDAGLRTEKIRPGDTDAPADAFTGEDNSGCIHDAYWNFQAKASHELDLPVLPTPKKPDTHPAPDANPELQYGVPAAASNIASAQKHPCLVPLEAYAPAP
jgi:hypothetical protein